MAILVEGMVGYIWQLLETVVLESGTILRFAGGGPLEIGIGHLARAADISDTFGIDRLSAP